ncbi:hypothetical protein GCM10025864_01730 [Luteimicrobium album]|uniref:Secreted protein n=1 Tax=Luteimicrobium album TaxID=1054550 RepID=A0ABQ6HY48_9MICO|nr:hypothetical protein GCM10025864_01730 [Luteimicrobium album]
MRATLAVGTLAAVCLVPTGCTGVSCNGPGAFFPTVSVDASAWFTAHPGASSGRACLGDVCDDLSSGDATARLEVSRGSYDDPQHVTVTLPTAKRTSTGELTVTLGSTSVTGPCGTVTNRGRVVEVAGDGTLTAAGVLP